METNVPDGASLTLGQLESIEHMITSQPRLSVSHELALAVNTACTRKAWHSRDAEVAELEDDILRIQALGNERLTKLQKQLDATEKSLRLWQTTMKEDDKDSIIWERKYDAALEQVRALVKAGEAAMDWLQGYGEYDAGKWIDMEVAITSAKEA